MNISEITNCANIIISFIIVQHKMVQILLSLDTPPFLKKNRITLTKTNQTTKRIIVLILIRPKIVGIDIPARAYI